VIASADAHRDEEGAVRPIAVLVQLQLDAPLGGVMFGVDPVTGNTDQIVVEAVPSRPDTLVGGAVTAAHYVLDRRGRVREQLRATDATALSADLRRRLVDLAARGATTFGCPQDIEWAVDRDDRLWMLQSRPVTAVAPHGGRGHVFGPGPVAETFPDPLRRLEVDLFAAPLRDGITTALRATGAATERQLASSPVLTTIDGRAAVDLELLGVVSGHRSWRSWISPSAILRRLGAAWRVGRARVALPTLAADVVATVDEHLESIPALDALAGSQLLDLVHDARRELVTVHTYEILAGMLLHASPTAEPAPSGAAVALHGLAAGRADGLDDTAIVARHPEVLALVAPAIAPLGPLPRAAAVAPGARAVPDLDQLAPREALRLRCRWLQELLARLALELGRRLADDGRLDSAGLVRELDLGELVAAVTEGTLPDELAARATAPGGPQLPEAFRLSSGGEVLATRHRRAAAAAGIPAGGGRVEGVARHRVRPGERAEATILVTRHLEPTLAPLLPGIDGLVAETGSALSHLAILAREMHVATVVGVPDALVRFPPGTRLVVDGTTGEVAVRDEEAAR
jgi:pyruvate,water dikinase